MALSSLPASWHGIGVNDSKPVNQVTPLKRPRSIKLGPPLTNNTKKNPISPITPTKKPETLNSTTGNRPGAPPERKTWIQRPKFDPSNLKRTSTTPGSTSDTSPKTPVAKLNGLKESTRPLRHLKPRMPSTLTTKPRAKSAGNNQELKARTQEDTNMEILSLRKELAHSRDENTLLKGKLRRTDEDFNKKIKNLEKQLATAKKDCSGIEKKKDSTNESLAALKQKCQKLEVELKSKEQSLRKLEANTKTAAMANGTSKSLASVPTKQIPLIRQTSSAPVSRSLPKTNQAINNELNKTKDSLKKLEQENLNLKQKLKDRDQEIKTLKVHLSKAQKVPSTLVRASFGSPNSPNVSKLPSPYTPSAGPNQAKTTQRVSRTSLYRTNTGTRSTTSTTVTTVTNGTLVKKGKSVTIEQPEEKADVLIIEEIGEPPKNKEDSNRSKENAQEIQRKTAARKIQRSWRSHRERVKKVDEPVQDQINGTENLIIYQAAEHVEIPQEHGEFLPEALDLQTNHKSLEHEGIDLLNFSQGTTHTEESSSILKKSKNDYQYPNEN